MPFNASDLTASASVTYSATSMSGIIVVVVIACFLASLASLGIFRRYMKAFGYIGKFFLHLIEGGGVYLAGLGIYRSVIYAQENVLITWDLVFTWTKWVTGLTILGYVSHRFGLKIYENIKVLYFPDQGSEVSKT